MLTFTITLIVSFLVLTAIDRARMAARRKSVLAQLVAGDLTGADLVAGSGGKLGRSTCYVVLADMERRGLIDGKFVPVGPGILPRRVYRVTNEGRVALLRDS